MRLITPLFILLFAGAALSASGAVIVSWGGPYVGSEQETQRTETSEIIPSGVIDNKASDLGSVDPAAISDGFDDGRIGYSWDTSAQLNPVIGADFSGTSDTYYGGFVREQISHPALKSPAGPRDLVTGDLSSVQANQGNQFFGVANSGGTDPVQVNIQGSASVLHRGYHAQYWKQEDFIGVGPTDCVSFDSTSSISITLTNTSAHIRDEGQLRFIVEEAGVFYISEIVFDNFSTPDLDNGTFTLDSSNAFLTDDNDGNWAVYDPSGLDLNFDMDGASYTMQNFTKVTSVGFYIETDIFSGAVLRYNIVGFEVDAVVTPIPEPGSIALLGLGVLGFVGWRVRRRKKKPTDQNAAAA
ncbi:MAG: PEP-CTERM sorting domain-containing protein [Planctomycetales bacterium]